MQFYKIIHEFQQKRLLRDYNIDKLTVFWYLKKIENIEARYMGAAFANRSEQIESNFFAWSTK